MLVAESFLKSLIKTYGKHTIYSDGSTWYHQACSSSLGLKHRLHTPFEKNLIERAVQYFKDRTECFDDITIRAGTSDITSYMYTNGQDYSCL